MREGGRNRKDEFRVFGRVSRKEGGGAGVILQVPEPQSESTDGLIVVVVPFPFSALPWGLGTVHSYIFFTHCPTQPFHHTAYECQHFLSCP